MVCRHWEDYVVIGVNTVLSAKTSNHPVLAYFNFAKKYNDSTTFRSLNED